MPGREDDAYDYVIGGAGAAGCVGRGPDAVVDAELRVHGLEEVRVERAADLIRGRAAAAPMAASTVAGG